MEKICARCQFRNPPVRGVCQVCGFAKFHCIGTQAVAIAKQPEAPFSALLNQTIAAVASAIEKVAEANKHTNDLERSNSFVAPATAPKLGINADDTQTATTFEANDLESMIAWFKSYGIDKPLILSERKTKDQPKNAA